MQVKLKSHIYVDFLFKSQLVMEINRANAGFFTKIICEESKITKEIKKKNRIDLEFICGP